jgi:hypothetical protein
MRTKSSTIDIAVVNHALTAQIRPAVPLNGALARAVAHRSSALFADFNEQDGRTAELLGRCVAVRPSPPAFPVPHRRAQCRYRTDTGVIEHREPLPKEHQ